MNSCCISKTSESRTNSVEFVLYLQDACASIGEQPRSPGPGRTSITHRPPPGAWADATSHTCPARHPHAPALAAAPYRRSASSLQPLYLPPFRTIKTLLRESPAASSSAGHAHVPCPEPRPRARACHLPVARKGRRQRAHPLSGACPGSQRCSLRSATSPITGRRVRVACRRCSPRAWAERGLARQSANRRL